MERTFPCSNNNCIFVHPRGVGTTGGCQCLDFFPMPVEVRSQLRREIRAATTRAFEKGMTAALKEKERY